MFMSVVPLFDRNFAVNAYLFLAQKSTNLMVDTQNAFAMDGANHFAALDTVNNIGLDALTGGLPLFIPINNIALLMDLESMCNAEAQNIIFIIDNAVTMDQMYINRIEDLKRKGYKIAIQNVTDYTGSEVIIDLCDYLLLNSRNKDIDIIKQYLRSRFHGLKIVLKNVATSEEFLNYESLNFDLYEGLFYRMPVTKGKNEVSPLKANYVQLMNITNDENFDIGHVASVVQQDTALAISLLRMVNSLRLASEVKSIKNAAAILGQRELRKWITTAVVSQLCMDKPNEITRISLIRAKFAEFLAPSFRMGIHAKELFLMGLFSVIDIILDMPMDKALDSVKVTNDIRLSLAGNTGKYAPVLDFIKTYETADWQKVSFLLITHNIPADEVSRAFMDSIKWYSELISDF